MTDFQISGVRGRSIGWQFDITRNGVGIDVTQAGMQLVVTGKLRTDDATPVFKATLGAEGGPGNITTPDPETPETVQVDVPADEAGILALTQTSYIQVSAVLTEPDGRETEVATGVIKLRVTAGS